jgi:hypothetical protein
MSSADWEIVRSSSLSSVFKNDDQTSLFKVVFNAPFYKNVGFATKRAADTLMPYLQDVYQSAMDAIMKVVYHERLKVKNYLLMKHKSDISKANRKDKNVAEERQIARFERYKEQRIAELKIQKEKEQRIAELEKAAKEQQIAELERYKKQQIVEIQKDKDQQFVELEKDKEQQFVELEKDKEQQFVEIEKDKDVDHFQGIMNICKSDPENTISKQVMKYMRDNNLI